MMKKYIVFVFAFIALLVSCKNNNDANKEAVQKAPKVKEKVSKEFRVSIKGKFSKEDSFQLYYIEDESETYSEKKSIWAKVDPSDASQEVTFVIPNEIYPNNIRLDLGINKEQVSIDIEEIKLSYKKNQLVILGSEVKDYFALNRHMKQEDVSNTFELVTVDTDGVEYMTHVCLVVISCVITYLRSYKKLTYFFFRPV